MIRRVSSKNTDFFILFFLESEGACSLRNGAFIGWLLFIGLENEQSKVMLSNYWLRLMAC